MLIDGTDRWSAGQNLVKGPDLEGRYGTERHSLDSDAVWAQVSVSPFGSPRGTMGSRLQERKVSE